MIVLAQGPGDSGTYFFVDLAAGKVEAVGWEYPTILQASVAATKTITYKAADGLDMQGIVTLPVGQEAKNAPLVVLPHGGPASFDFIHFDFWAQALASRGYVVFQPNFRGSNGFGKAFRDAGNGEWGRKMQTDISDGVAELARQGLADPKRACIVGASYGGYAALAGVTVQQGLYKCAVSVGGVSDINDMLLWDVNSYGETSEAMRIERRWFGINGNGGGALNSISPRRLADKADAPILLIYGKDDTVVSVDQSRAMADALRHAGKPVEVLQMSQEDHWLSKAATRTAMLEACVAFVEKYNPADPAK
jgi:dipeptidyl aminopeptidase/acylaminoacyl peptidase